MFSAKINLNINAACVVCVHSAVVYRWGTGQNRRHAEVIYAHTYVHTYMRSYVPPRHYEKIYIKNKIKFFETSIIVSSGCFTRVIS